MKSEDNYSNYTQAEINVKLSSACFDGDLEQVKFLLTSPLLSKKADIHYNDNEPLQYAINSGNLDVIHYLLKSNELKEKADIHACEDVAFKYAIFKKKLDVLQYLIFDFDINKTDNIQSILCYPLRSSVPMEEETVERVQKMFEMRDLKKSLHGDLANNSANKQKAKI